MNKPKTFFDLDLENELYCVHDLCAVRRHSMGNFDGLRPPKELDGLGPSKYLAKAETLIFDY